MNNSRKIVILSLVFVLPAITFLFLKMFGENKFEIPVLKDAQAISACDTTLSEILKDHIDVVWINNAACEDGACRSEIDQLKRVALRYESVDALVFTVFSDVVNNVNWPGGNLSTISTEQAVSMECVGEETNSNRLLLFDPEGRLRGVYEVTREDVDRLMIELDILIRYK